MKCTKTRRSFLIQATSLSIGVGLMPSVSFSSIPTLYFDRDVLSSHPFLKKGKKQIFVDSERVAKTQKIIRMVHPAQKFKEPVLMADIPWEQGAEYNGKKDRRIYIYGTVLRNPQTGQFQMWYNRLKTNYYALSTDGINWHRPGLKQPGKNNKIELFNFHSPSIIEDSFETDPEKRFKAIGSVKSTISDEDIQYLKTRFGGYDWYKGSSAYSAAYSPDGINWKLYPLPIIIGGDTITLAQDPETGEYLAFHKNKNRPDEKGRKVFLSVSKNMQDWTKPVLVMEADKTDHLRAQLLDGGTHAEIYNMSAFPYAGQWLGLITVFHRTGAPKVKGPGQSGHDGPIHVQLVHSRDGRNWKRCSDRFPAIGLGPFDYDSGSILGVCNSPVIVGDEMWVYYTAMTTTHGGYLPDKQMSIARAVWRLDGMVSMQAGTKEGMVETTSWRPEGKQLFVNADVRGGHLLAEVLDSKGKVIRGYERENCISFTGSSTDRLIKWERMDMLPSNKSIRLRFYIMQGDLYSYKIA
ncbi:hypothetical protein [Membranihabitans maritimus]|uniref:hypothetical protein n=1 Tax=Membranihabitans maritimus TaxID=2904244 RepID=UPI001F4613ED|nr:hypothetical protein [Membranihabitans maritimus]